MACGPAAPGVADGVGGWALSGVDSGEYSRLLMDLAQFFAESKKLDVHPKQVGTALVQVPLLMPSRLCRLSVWTGHILTYLLMISVPASWHMQHPALTVFRARCQMVM